MAKSLDAFQQAGCSVLAVSFAPVEQVAEFAEKMRLPFPIWSDPQRRIYATLGMERMPARRLWQPRVILGYLRRILQGWLPWRPAPGADVLQLGGDLILDRQGRVVFLHKSADPTDRPSVQAMLDALAASQRSADAEHSN